MSLHDELLGGRSRKQFLSDDVVAKVKEHIAICGANQLDSTNRTPLDCCVMDVRLTSREPHTGMFLPRPLSPDEPAPPPLVQVVRGKVIDLLLKKGADPDFRDSRGWTLLHLAAWRGDLFFIQQCLKLGKGTVQALNHDNQLPMHLAALKGHTHISHYLDSRSGDLRCMCRAVIRTALGKRCTELDKLVFPPRLKFFLNYNIPYKGFSAVLVPPEPWTLAQLHGKEVDSEEIREFIRSHASQEFLQSHTKALGEGGEPSEQVGEIVELFQDMYLWEAFKNVDYEEPLPRAPRYTLQPIDKSKNKD